MGSLVYDNSLKIDFEDRLLAHLQIVIGMKLRRGEAFYLSWKDDQEAGDGRTSVWMHPTIPLVFKFLGGHTPSINRNWVTLMEHSANTNAGLHLMEEPAFTEHGSPLS